jgi:hypothetical protein
MLGIRQGGAHPLGSTIVGLIEERGEGKESGRDLALLLFPSMPSE